MLSYYLSIFQEVVSTSGLFIKDYLPIIALIVDLTMKHDKPMIRKSSRELFQAVGLYSFF